MAQEEAMTRDHLLALARLYHGRDQAVPLTTLAEADDQGLLLTEFGQPNTKSVTEKESLYGQSTEKDFHDWADDTVLCLPD